MTRPTRMHETAIIISLQPISGIRPSCAGRRSCSEAQHLWPLTNEVIAYRRFESLDEVQEVQAARCIVLAVRSTPSSSAHAFPTFGHGPGNAKKT
jgi:hypothetical protein